MVKAVVKMGDFIEICLSKATAQMQSSAIGYSISMRVPFEHLYMCGCMQVKRIVSASTSLVVLLQANSCTTDAVRDVSQS